MEGWREGVPFACVGRRLSCCRRSSRRCRRRCGLLLRLLCLRLEECLLVLRLLLLVGVQEARYDVDVAESRMMDEVLANVTDQLDLRRRRTKRKLEVTLVLQQGRHLQLGEVNRLHAQAQRQHTGSERGEAEHVRG